VNVRADQALARRAARLFRRLGEAALPQDERGGFEVAVRLLEGGFALHHAGAGGVAKGLDLCCGNLCHD
jgi:hypothetical protein